MRLTRPALALVAVGCAVALTGTSSAAPPVSWTDLAGDGNAINGQAFSNSTLDGGTVTPTSEKGSDIVKVSIATMTKTVKKKKVCDGFTAIMTLSGPPVQDRIYRVLATTTENPSLYYLAYDTFEGSTVLRFARSATVDDTLSLKYPAKVKGNTITFRVPMSDVKLTNEKAGSTLKGLSATVAHTVQGMLFLPVYDKSRAPATKTYSICD